MANGKPLIRFPVLLVLATGLVLTSLFVLSWTDFLGWTAKLDKVLQPLKHHTETKHPSLPLFFQEGLAVSDSGGLYGYRDSTRAWAILPQYQEAHAFHQGRARVRLSDRYGYIRKEGGWLLPACFYDAEDFREGYAAALVGEPEDGLWGFIDTAGQWQINPVFAQVRKGFSQGLALVSLPGLLEAPMVYIDTSGGMVFDEAFRDGDLFHRGEAIVQCGFHHALLQNKPFHWGVIDRSGAFLSACIDKKPKSL